MACERNVRAHVCHGLRFPGLSGMEWRPRLARVPYGKACRWTAERCNRRFWVGRAVGRGSGGAPGGGKHAVHVWVRYRAGTSFVCLECSAVSPVYDHDERSWRHLATCQLQTRLHAAVPRVQCATHGVRTAQVRVGLGAGDSLNGRGSLLTFVQASIAQAAGASGPSISADAATMAPGTDTHNRRGTLLRITLRAIVLGDLSSSAGSSGDASLQAPTRCRYGSQCSIRPTGLRFFARSAGVGR